MRIHFEKSGGFTGIHLATTVDTNELPPQEAARLLQELDQSGLLERDPSTLEGAPGSGPDSITYELTLEVGSYEHTYCMTDETAPDSLQPLFRQLTMLARRTPTSGDTPW